MTPRFAIARHHKLRQLIQIWVYASLLPATIGSAKDYVTYEEFGAVGDGVHDDLPAIVKAHDYANTHGKAVKSKSEATYHLGSRALTAIIATDTDWNTSRFTIDDRKVEDHKKALFEVRSQLEPTTLPIERLKKGQQAINLQIAKDYFVKVTNDRIMHYIRRGPNQNNGRPQTDCFILKRDGTIEGPIDWDYDHISTVEARPIDEDTLTIRGGVFTTVANNMRQEVGYNYWSRNIEVMRSNTIIDGLTHYVAGETSIGHPYRGFVSISDCANITIQNSFFTGRKRYTTIGSAGKPVSMGSYDIHANSVVNFSMINCRMNHILDRTRWGVIATNFCKNILLEDCILSRMDAHMGVSGYYIIRRSTLGHMGLNAIGRGLLVIEDSTLHGPSLINFRGDYGSTWEGDIEIRNTRWKPLPGNRSSLYVFNTSNDGQHDFGYQCFMPRNISIEGLTIDDSHHSGDLYYFRDLGKTNPANTPYPYVLTDKLTVHKVSTASGRRPRLSGNPYLNENVIFADKDMTP